MYSRMTSQTRRSSPGIVCRGFPRPPRELRELRSSLGRRSLSVPAAVRDDDGMSRLDKLPHRYRAEVEGAAHERYAHDEKVLRRRLS